MAQHPMLALPNDPDEDKWKYYEWFQINPTIFDDHLVLMPPVSLVNESLDMNVYKVCNLTI